MKKKSKHQKNWQRKMKSQCCAASQLESIPVQCWYNFLHNLNIPGVLTLISCQANLLLFRCNLYSLYKCGTINLNFNAHTHCMCGAPHWDCWVELMADSATGRRYYHSEAPATPIPPVPSHRSQLTRTAALQSDPQHIIPGRYKSIDSLECMLSSTLRAEHGEGLGM